jgi:hypothetical protein
MPEFQVGQFVRVRLSAADEEYFLRRFIGLVGRVISVSYGTVDVRFERAGYLSHLDIPFRPEYLEDIGK